LFIFVAEIRAIEIAAFVDGQFMNMSTPYTRSKHGKPVTSIELPNGFEVGEVNVASFINDDSGGRMSVNKFSVREDRNE
jgi:hypothetical protein